MPRSVASELDHQSVIDAQIASTTRVTATSRQPVLDFPAYRSSRLRHPTLPPARVDPEGVELSAPVFGELDLGIDDADLTVHGIGEPIGSRIRVRGRVFDADGRPVRGQLVEIWQANAAGRYAHQVDRHPAPLDPNFFGVGRCLTDDEGWYSFTTIRPGPYPWRNHHNAWRPAHIHFSFFGRTFTERLVTQMYFPDDPLFELDPVLASVTDAAVRSRLVAAYEHESSEHEWLLGFRWDVTLGGTTGVLTETAS